ncbi:hypothetical protein KQX54_006214 [Cotesia glomerata]|uniref:Uncharacterized protein n=1 Tax=Cotesia glomerata TaxID=32391 RepID=A0AAV7IJE5_COTGL|nr:hypothetical protein KQX54_006214 [Cotesia glomerata]
MNQLLMGSCASLDEKYRSDKHRDWNNSSRIANRSPAPGMAAWTRSLLLNITERRMITTRHVISIKLLIDSRQMFKVVDQIEHFIANMCSTGV